MKLTLEPTPSMTELGILQDVPVRLWSGFDEHGVPVIAFIAMVAVPEAAGREAQERFGRELVSVINLLDADAPTETAN